MKRFEIWVSLPGGLPPVKVETHRSAKSAKRAIDEMNRANDYNENAGFGFRYGRPIYTIREVEVYNAN